MRKPKILSNAEIDKLTLEQKAKYLAALEKTRVETIFPHFTFKPNPPQKRFLQMMNDGVLQRKHFDFAATWGTWTGKTTLLGAMIANMTCKPENQASCFKALPLFQNWPFSKTIRIGCAPDQMNEMTGAVWLALMAWMPKDGSWEAVKAGKHYPSIIKWKNTGWTLDVRTYDQLCEGKESADIGFYAFDEPPPLEDWHRAAGRRKHGGIRAIFGSFIDDDGEQPALFEEILEDPKVEYFFSSTEENFKSRGGYLDDEIALEMMKAWPKYQYNARRTGRPNLITSKVFVIDPDVHIAPAIKPGDMELTCYLAFDPHDVRPGVIGIYGWDSTGVFHVVDEWPNMESHGRLYPEIQTDNLGNEQYAKLLNSHIRKWGVRTNIIDSNFADTAYKNDFASTTLRQELFKHGGIRFVDGVKKVMGAAGGVQRIRELLDVKETKLGKRSHMVIHANCQNHIAAFNKLKRKRMKDELTGKVSDELEERWLDFPRCAMYAAMHRKGWIEPEKQEPQTSAYGLDFVNKVFDKIKREHGIDVLDREEDFEMALA